MGESKIRTEGRMTGDELKAARTQRGLSRRTLAERAEVHPDTVKYWEAKATVDLRGWGPKRLLQALGIDRPSNDGLTPPRRTAHASWGIFRTPTRARDGVLEKSGGFPGAAKSRSGQCGARTRKGTPCRAKALPGKMRCKYHGGMSTGPKTPEGRERISEAQRRRWTRR